MGDSLTVIEGEDGELDVPLEVHLFCEGEEEELYGAGCILCRIAGKSEWLSRCGSRDTHENKGSSVQVVEHDLVLRTIRVGRSNPSSFRAVDRDLDSVR